LQRKTVLFMIKVISLLIFVDFISIYFIYSIFWQIENGMPWLYGSWIAVICDMIMLSLVIWVNVWVIKKLRIRKRLFG
jgi:hypothetical protein